MNCSTLGCGCCKLLPATVVEVLSWAIGESHPEGMQFPVLALAITWVSVTFLLVWRQGIYLLGHVMGKVRDYGLQACLSRHFRW